jgi:hypothetical protein
MVGRVVISVTAMLALDGCYLCGAKARWRRCQPRACVRDSRPGGCLVFYVMSTNVPTFVCSSINFLMGDGFFLSYLVSREITTYGVLVCP